MNAPCKGCLDRHFNCHGTCHKYQQFKLENEKIAEQKEKERLATPSLCRKVVKQIWKEERWK